jgi:glycosyltransferase involved in cell wall biosynthesis
VDEGVTGIITPRNSVEKLALAIESLVIDKPKRKEMGQAARKRVDHLYNWEKNLQLMHSLYERAVNRAKNPQ